MEPCPGLSVPIFCVTKTCYVAMPSGYKLVITRALGMHGTYCTQPSGLTPSCFSAIYAIHPSCPCYNYNVYTYIIIVMALLDMDELRLQAYSHYSNRHAKKEPHCSYKQHGACPLTLRSKGKLIQYTAPIRHIPTSGKFYLRKRDKNVHHNSVHT